MTKIESRDVPQANSLSVVGNLLALAGADIVDKRRLSRELPLALHEVDYYMHAARILGFAEFEKIQDFVITDKGRAYLEAKTPSEKRRLLANAVRSAEIFGRLLERHSESDLDREKIANFLKEVTSARLNTTTARRRADTIISWLKFIRSGDD